MKPWTAFVTWFRNSSRQVDLTQPDGNKGWKHGKASPSVPLPSLVKSSSTLSSVGDRLALSLHLAATLWKHWTWLSHSVKIALGHHTLKILHLARPQNIVLVRNYPCTLHTIYWEVSTCHTTLLSYTWWAYYEGLTTSYLILWVQYNKKNIQFTLNCAFVTFIFQTNNKKYLTNIHQREISHDFKVHGISYPPSFSGFYVYIFTPMFLPALLGQCRGGSKKWGGDG